MTEPSAHRTLVKSPPELWAEISEPEALARHLGEFGEIQITRLEPETTVAWEGERASGTVHLEPSSWGTKVTLTASVTAPARPARPAEPEPMEVAQPEPVVVAESAAAAPEAVVEPEASPAAEPEPAAQASRTSRWSRFLRRRPDAIEQAEPEAVAPEQAEPEAVAPEQAEPEAVAPEQVAPEQAGAEADEIVAKLGAVLDDLGSAHHRPFSR